MFFSLAFRPAAPMNAVEGSFERLGEQRPRWNVGRPPVPAVLDAAILLNGTLSVKDGLHSVGGAGGPPIHKTGAAASRPVRSACGRAENLLLRRVLAHSVARLRTETSDGYSAAPRVGISPARIEVLGPPR